MRSMEVGRILRALRHRRGWTQQELATRVGCSRSVVSRVERGHTDAGVSTLEQMARALDARLVVTVQWRGGELDRLLDVGHAALREQWARRRAGWFARSEVTYSEWGERGSIDELAYHAASRSLLVVELKTVIADTQALLARLDAKVRLAPRLARRLGWQVERVVPCLVVADTKTNRRRVAAHPAAFAEFACRGLAARRWLAAPLTPTGGLLLFEPPPRSDVRGAHVRPPGRQRIRHLRTDASVATLAAHVGRGEPAP